MLPSLKPKKKVAAYARISMETEKMLHSLSAQVSFYSAYIQKNPEWEYVGVYSDEGISGTGTKKRTGFRQLIADCEAGKIDIVLTKSISRFARNTVDLLETVRHLKSLGIEVHFEKEHLNSMSGEGELMLTILASFAQEESRSISDNVKWGIRKGFQRGKVNGGTAIYGYRWDGEKYVIEPVEAEIVKQIFADFRAGISPWKIGQKLAEKQLNTVRGITFYADAIRRMLKNVTYTGNMLLQKTYIADAISKKSKKNNGELPRYYVEGTHEAIIDKATFDLAQKELQRRSGLGVLANRALNITCFTRKIQCGICGKSFNRRADKYANGAYHVSWICGTRKKAGSCTNKYLPEEILKNICAEVLNTQEFDEEVFLEKIERIVVPGKNEVIFYFHDGRILQKQWESTAHKDWWTPERRAARSQMVKRKAMNDDSKKSNHDTSNP